MQHDMHEVAVAIDEPLPRLGGFLALQLLAACERTETLRTVVVRGSAAIYGCEGAAPLLFSEGMARRYPLKTRFQRDAKAPTNV